MLINLNINTRAQLFLNYSLMTFFCMTLKKSPNKILPGECDIYVAQKASNGSISLLGKHLYFSH